MFGKPLRACLAGCLMRPNNNDGVYLYAILDCGLTSRYVMDSGLFRAG